MLQLSLAALMAVLAAPGALAQGPCAGIHVSAYLPSGEHGGTRVELYSVDAWDAGSDVPTYALTTDASGDARFGSLSVGEYVVSASREGYVTAPARFMCLSATHSRLHLALWAAPDLPPPAAPEACESTPPLTLALTTEQVRCALASGADPNATDDEGWAPLHTAVNRSDEAAIRLLAEAGARMDVLAPRGGSILHHAVVFAAAAPGTIQLLVDLGAALDAVDQDGNTPLHWASRFDNASGVRALLEAGADPNARTPDEYAYSPLHVAFLGSVDAAAIPVLLGYGADPALRDGDGRTALDIALEAAGGEYTNFGSAIETLRAALAD